MNLYNKEKKYEEIIQEFQSQQEMDFTFINSINDVMIDLSSKLASNKLMTAFESDDYIGFYFNDIKRIHSDVLVYLQKYNTLYINNGNIDGEEEKTK